MERRDRRFSCHTLVKLVAVVCCCCCCCCCITLFSLYIIVMRVGPVSVHRNDMDSYLRSLLSAETDVPPNPAVVPKSAVMIWIITFIDSHCCLKIVNLPRDLPDPV